MSEPHASLRPIARWLAWVYGLIAAMVVIGGITRLTGSGLSMVEWQPLMGAVPPLSEADWLAVFAQYQRTPQYAQVNHWMQLGDFKAIFFWEYLHRVLGRLIGVAFLVPWLVFWARRQLRGPLAARTFVAFLLGGAQGLLGWYMVQSGLVNVPEVSHFRLAAHLSLALGVALYVQWLWMGLRWPRPASAAADRALPLWLPVTTLALLSLQVVYGAFMAGKRAGKIFSSFPDMNGELLPLGWRSGAGLLRDLTEHPVAIHVAHRTLAWIVLAACLALGAVAMQGPGPRLRRAGVAVAGLALLQVGLGAATVWTGVHIAFAVAHQGTALVLLSSVVAVVYLRSGQDENGC